MKEKREVDLQDSGIWELSEERKSERRGRVTEYWVKVMVTDSSSECGTRPS